MVLPTLSGVEQLFYTVEHGKARRFLRLAGVITRKSNSVLKRVLGHIHIKDISLTAFQDREGRWLGYILETNSVLPGRTSMVDLRQYLRRCLT